MDFIAFEVDETWKIFQQPQSIYSEVYEASKFAATPSVKLAQVFAKDTGCTGPLNNDTCSTTADRIPFNGFSFGLSVLVGPPNSLSPFGDTAPTDEFQIAEQDNELNNQTEEQRCVLEQHNERNSDNAAQQATDDINAKDSINEHATFGVRDGNQITTITISTGDSESADVVSLYASLREAGFDMSDVVFFIHSHPSSTISDADWAASEDFTNQFPSDNDLEAYAEFADDAVEAGANRNT